MPGVSIRSALDQANLEISRTGPTSANSKQDNSAMDIDSPQMNGAAKRKSRSSITKISYKDESDDSDGQPLVRANSTIGIMAL